MLGSAAVCLTKLRDRLLICITSFLNDTCLLKCPQRTSRYWPEDAVRFARTVSHIIQTGLYAADFVARIERSELKLVGLLVRPNYESALIRIRRYRNLRSEEH